MQFEAGQSGNPKGRPKGAYGGRIQALAALDRMVNKKKNQALLTRALEASLEKDPERFFRTYVMPLLPKESKLHVQQDGIVEWKSLTEAFPLPKQLGEGTEEE